MTTANENATDLQARPLVVSRTFLVPRAWVFKAWTSAEHIRRWFCPAGFSVPQAEIDFRVGGVFNVCMRSPEGQDYWTRGHYTEIVPDARLVIEMSAVDDQGKPLFHAHTVATFTDAQGGTRLEVTQRYTVLVPSVAEAMLRGARRAGSRRWIAWPAKPPGCRSRYRRSARPCTRASRSSGRTRRRASGCSRR